MQILLLREKNQTNPKTRQTSRRRWWGQEAMYLERKIIFLPTTLKLPERAACSGLLLQVIFKGQSGVQLASINGSSISLKITAQKYHRLYGLFWEILTDFSVHVCRCSLACWAGFIMETCSVLVTDSSDFNWRSK